ncbi:hypothetical protein SOPP22_12500 [Shewanella sp. OPT22]|nr:hypothetical protein SOPP22_12500 [Shewanella sp. OPT22]
MFNRKKCLTLHFSTDTIGYSKEGWTYIFLSNCCKYAKIGHTKANTRERLLYASQTNPYRRLNLQFWVAFNSAALEYDFHEYFSRYRANYLLNSIYDGKEDLECNSTKELFTKREVNNFLLNKACNTYRDYFQKTNTELFEFPLPITKSCTLKKLVVTLESLGVTINVA